MRPGYTQVNMNTDGVSLVIPGRNCERTIRQCLSAVAPLVDNSRLHEIIFVDDGSTDRTAEIVAEFPVTRLPGAGRGPGAARNLGWRRAQHAYIWFVDADCVAEADALDHLLAHMDDSKVAAVSGSYGIMNPESLLASLIHEEIITRHRAMSSDVNFLATFNVVYRRAVLEEVGGFNERFLKGQDAELSFRVLAAGYGLRFALDSRVKHFHETSWLAYLKTQRQQGFWRVPLHLTHSGHAAGDSYSGLIDHIQPPLAVLILLSTPLLPFERLALVPAALIALLGLAQIPMTARILSRLRSPGHILFSVLGFVRAFWRAVGMVSGLLMCTFARSRVLGNDKVTLLDAKAGDSS